MTSGVIERYGGAILRSADGKIATHEDCCDGCLHPYVKIADYEDGDLAVCAPCPAGTGEIWDGRISRSGYCAWAMYGNGAYTINSKDLYCASCAWIALVGEWRLLVTCDKPELAPDKQRIWYGQRAGARSDGPVGVYTRTSGCDTTAELAIEWG